MMKFLLFGFAGALGAFSRYWMSTAVKDALGRESVLATFAVNLLGCLLFGLFWVLAEEKRVVPPGAATIVLTGFLGAFTTFSAFVHDSNRLLAQSQTWPALGNLAGQVVFGLLALQLGLWAGRNLWS
jgi:CrcB protein